MWRIRKIGTIEHNSRHVIKGELEKGDSNHDSGMTVCPAHLERKGGAQKRTRKKETSLDNETWKGSDLS